MAVRSHTAAFLQLRDSAAASRAYSSPTQDDAVVSLVDAVGEDGRPIKPLPRHALEADKVPPQWLHQVKPITTELTTIKSRMDQLSKFHGSVLLATFGSKQDDQRSVDEVSAEIQRLFQLTRTQIKKLGEGAQMQLGEEKMRDNIQSLLAARLQDLSLQFKRQQKDYLDKLKESTAKRSKLPTLQSEFDDEVGDLDSVGRDRGFDGDQRQAAAMMNRQVQQREREIRQIAKSVNELAEIFQDMAKLVHEQGTILDRIDYNIETAKTHVTEAKKELGQAATYASSARNKYCIILLILVIFGTVFSMIVALKGR